MTRIKSDRVKHDKRYVRNYFRELGNAIVFVLLALLSVEHAVAEGIKIHRCIGANGEPTFSDRPCSITNPLSQAHVAPSTSPTTHASALIVTQTCPTSPEDLRSRITVTFAAQNGVSLSGLFLWEGHARDSSTSALTALAKLVTEPLISIDLDKYVANPTDSTQRNTSSDTQPQSINVRTARELERVPREATTRFGLTSRLGCWWLLFPE